MNNIRMLYVLIISVLLLLNVQPGNSQTESTKSSKKLDVTIYYETLCYDSMMFFRQQLYPIWLRQKEFINIILIPYGKAIQNQNESTGEWIIDCQHGAAECKLNIVHACILENIEFQFAFPLIACGMRGFRTNIEECATRLNIDNFNAIKLCANSTKGIDLLVGYGNVTRAIDLSFVPSISIDKVFNYDDQRDLLYEFDKTFCLKYFEKFNSTLTECKQYKFQ